MQKTPTAVFIGQSPIDIITPVSEDFLAKYGIEKHGLKIITPEISSLIESEIKSPLYIPGGCAANTACCFSRLKGTAIFNGKIADDDFGRLFLKSLESEGVKTGDGAFRKANRPCDHIYIFITPDHDRSFASCIGITSEIAIEEIDNKCLKEADLVFLEGFLMANKGGYKTLYDAATLAREGDTPPLIAMCPCDSLIIRKNRKHIETLLEITDILIMNDKEAKTIFPGWSIEDIITFCRKRFKAGAITFGASGATGFREGRLHHAPAAEIRQHDIVNTNGAGDAFIGGFLYSYLSGDTLEETIETAQNCAVEVLKREGAR